MQVTDIIVILLFMIPGVIADRISQFLDVCDRKKDSEFQEIINGVLTSLPIIFIIALFSYGINEYTNTQEFIDAFGEIYYVLTFALWTLILTLVWGITKGILAITNFSIVNYLRCKLFNQVAIDNKSSWQKFFLTDGNSQFLVVENNGKTYEGFIKSYSLPGEEKELELYIPEVLDHYPEYREKIYKVNKTYINIEKNIVIKDYDMTEYNNWVDQLTKELQQTIS